MTPTQEYVVPRSIPITGPLGLPSDSTELALATGRAARGQNRRRRNARIPTPRRAPLRDRRGGRLAAFPLLFLIVVVLSWSSGGVICVGSNRLGFSEYRANGIRVSKAWLKAEEDDEDG